MDARERYRLATSLAQEPSEATARTLVEMLGDDGSFELDDGVWLYDRDPTVATVAGAALESLAAMPAVAWPVIVEALPSATEDVIRAMLTVLDHLKPEQRSALPASAHDAIVAAASRFAALGALAGRAAWERDFARRVRANEFASAEAFWRARLESDPDSPRGRQALSRLIEIDPDKTARALELVSWLEGGGKMSPSTIIARLRELPPVLPPEVVTRLAASKHPRQHPELLPVLARHGEPAAALVPFCVELLQHTPIGNYVPWMPQSSLDDRRWRFAVDALRALGDIAAPARPVLVERLLATNEVASLQGSLRFRLIEALGDPVLLEAEIRPRIEELVASAEVVTSNRGKQLRDALASRGHG